MAIILVEYPSGPVSLNSRFYITRPPTEELAYEEIAKPGSALRIAAPRKMGKTSLLLRILARAEALGYRIIRLNFRQVDEAIYSDINQFLWWFCINVSFQLNLEPKLTDYWDKRIGSKPSCTLYFQNYLLARSQTPIVLVLSELNQMFAHPQVTNEFLTLVHSWYEEARHTPPFQNLRLILVYSTEAYIPLEIYQSSLNLGLPLELPEFTPKQIEDLALRHGLNLKASEIAALIGMVGGHPYLIRLALYALYRQEISLEQLLQTAATPAGIYRTHLQSILALLQTSPTLLSAVQQLARDENTKLPPMIAQQLEQMGIIRQKGDRVSFRFELYRRYFLAQELGQQDTSKQFAQLQSTNRELHKQLHLDKDTQIPNRDFFDYMLSSEWQKLAAEGESLSLIVCHVDEFERYQSAYGSLTGNFCLQLIAKTIRNCARRTRDLVARYSDEAFVLLLPRTDAAGALHLGEQIRLQVRALQIQHHPSQLAELPIPMLTVSLGIASAIPQAGQEPSALLQAAEEALIQSQHQGCDRLVLSSRFNWGASESQHQKPGIASSD